MQICTRTISAKEAEAAALAQAMQAYRGPIKQVDGFKSIRPLPTRTDRVDPETRLKRKSRAQLVIKPASHPEDKRGRGEANLKPVAAMIRRLEGLAE